MTCLKLIPVIVVAFVFVGCTPKPPASPPDVLPSHVEDGHDHDHGHGHDHAHGHSHEDLGPNGGHIIEIGKKEYHVEWLHDDASGKLTFFVLDSTAKKTVPIEASTISIEKKIGDNSETYELAAVAQETQEGKHAQFEIVDKPLVEALKAAGKGVEATVKLEIDGKPYSAKIEHHDHGHGHGHAH